MTTVVYGSSDDLIEFEGDIHGEVNAHTPRAGGIDGTLLIFDDGTQMVVTYGKPGLGGIWGLTLLRAGTLFDHIDVCTEETESGYSDVAYFTSGLKSCIAASEWERVK